MSLNFHISILSTWLFGSSISSSRMIYGWTDFRWSLSPPIISWALWLFATPILLLLWECLDIVPIFSNPLHRIWMPWPPCQSPSVFICLLCWHLWWSRRQFRQASLWQHPCYEWHAISGFLEYFDGVVLINSSDEVGGVNSMWKRTAIRLLAKLVPS